MVTAAAKEALEIKNLPNPPGLQIVEVVAEDYTDSTGDPALRVTVILDESVDAEKISGKAVSDLKFAILENLRQRGIDLFPYVFLATRSELAETDED